MGAVRCPYVEANANVTANSTAWVDVATISAGSFVAGHKYLVIAHGFVTSNSTTNEAKMRLVHGSGPTVFTDASFAYDMVTASSFYDIGYMTVFTQPGGGAEDVKIQISNSSTSTTTATHGAIACIDLDDYGTENTHWAYNEVTADYTVTTTFTDNGAVTISCNGTDKWAIIGSCTARPGSDTTQLNHRINDSVAGALASISIEGEDTATEVLGHMLMAVFTPSNASHTFSIQHSIETGGAGTVDRAAVVAINLSHFSQVVSDRNTATDTPAASPSWTTTLGLDPTPDATDSFLIWGFAAHDVNAVSDSVNVRLQTNASGGGLASTPNYGDDLHGPTPRIDTTDVFPINIFTKITLNSGAAREINFDFQRAAGTACLVLDRSLFAIRLDVAGGGAQTVDPGTTVVSISANSVIAHQTASLGAATVNTAGNQAVASPGEVARSLGYADVIALALALDQTILTGLLGQADVPVSANPTTPIPGEVSVTPNFGLVNGSANPATPVAGEVTVQPGASEVTVSVDAVTPVPGAINADANSAIVAVTANAIPQTDQTQSTGYAEVRTMANPATPVPGEVTVLPGYGQVAVTANPVDFSLATFTDLGTALVQAAANPLPQTDQNAALNTALAQVAAYGPTPENIVELGAALVHVSANGLVQTDQDTPLGTTLVQINGQPVTPVPGEVTVHPGQAQVTVVAYDVEPSQATFVQLNSALVDVTGQPLVQTDQNSAPNAAQVTAAGYPVVPSNLILLGLAQVTVEANPADAVPGNVTIQSNFALATVQGYPVTPIPGAVTAALGYAEVNALAYGAVANPGAILSLLGYAQVDVSAFPGVAVPGTVTIPTGYGTVTINGWPVIGEVLALQAMMGSANVDVSVWPAVALPGGIVTDLGYAEVDVLAYLVTQVGFIGNVTMGHRTLNRVIMGHRTLARLVMGHRQT